MSLLAGRKQPIVGLAGIKAPLPRLGPLCAIVRLKPLIASKCRTRLIRFAFSHGLGRSLPTTDVGYLVVQLEGQLSGGELARPTGASRPQAAGRLTRFEATKPTLAQLYAVA